MLKLRMAASEVPVFNLIVQLLLIEALYFGILGSFFQMVCVTQHVVIVFVFVTFIGIQLSLLCFFFFFFFFFFFSAANRSLSL